MQSLEQSFVLLLLRMFNSSYGICTTGTQRKAEKIDIFFDDHILYTKRFRLSMFPWVRIDELKKDLAITRYAKNLNWRDIRFFYKNIELKNNSKRLFDYNIEPEGTILITAHTNKIDHQLGIINPYEIFYKSPDEITHLLLNIKSGLTTQQIPKLAPEGTSGTYFLNNHLKKTVAIFKPFDEEPYAPNNPRNYIGKLGDQGIRKGILSGQCATRQVASYLLDDKKFHGVPATTYVEFYHPIFNYKEIIENDPILSTKENNLKLMNTKHGSMQQFVQSHDVAGNLSSKLFDTEQVHKIGILDLRILNCDRNEANILVRKMLLKQKEKQSGIKSKFYKLIPIDHGLSFPDNFQIYDYQLVWMNYPQAAQPFSERSLKFIDNIDPVEDCNKLREKLGFREICLRNVRIAETFLKKTAKAGFTLQQIGKMIYRVDDDQDSEQSDRESCKNSSKKELSQLQKLVHQAEQIYMLVKNNGIKSTIEFQIGLIRPRQKPLVPIFEQEETKDQVFALTTKKVQFQQELPIERRPSRIQQVEKPVLTQKVRNVSLPNLKNDSVVNQKIKMKKRRKREGPNGMHKAGRSAQQWEEIFYHYFEDLLDRFINEKKRINKRNLSPMRGRLMSQDLDDV